MRSTFGSAASARNTGHCCRNFQISGNLRRTAVSSTLRGSDQSMNVRVVDWFYVQNGKQIGPVPAAQFDDLVRAGQISPETLVWREGLANWQPFRLITATPSAVVSAGAPTVTPGRLTNCVECV